ncbi:MAG: hypothetical protein SOY94_01230 [Candidatus Limiplasma sp.]|nr:hypothetical protein [Candidatus Limiplasma sp.]
MADNDFMTGYVAGQNEGGRGGSGGFMDGAGSWVWILVIFALLFGWGGNSGWNSGNSGSGASMVYPYIGGIATRADINEGFALNGITSGITAIQQGICDSTYALNNTISNGFHGVDRSLCNGFNNLSTQLAQCCCDHRAAIADLKYTIATEDCATRNLMQNNTRDIIEGQNAGTRAILDYLTQNELATLRSENQTLRFAQSQSNQNAVLMAAMDANKAEILRRTGRECPIPAYVVPNPNCCYGNPVGVSYGYNQGNGCMGCAA